MAMNKVPTLILGIGGIGCRIAANINDLLREEDRKHIAIVGMDTNVNDLMKLENRGIRTIQTSDDRTVGEYLQMHPEYMSWFPVNQFTVSKSLLNGAGQIRAVSRLAALASEENGRFVPIKEEIQRIRENRGSNSHNNLTVMVVGSITGGTGAGIFLQMPFYIRKVMRGESGLNIVIRGMFVGPDLTVDVQPSKINKSAVRVNGYTCLKELNALYMRQTQAEGEGKLKVDFYEKRTDERSIMDDIQNALRDSDYYEEEMDPEAIREDAQVIAAGNPDIPYDYLYLIEGSNAKGGIGNAPLSSVESLAARMVHTLMFTPVSDNALSVEDNMVLQDMEKGGMNRYSSAGLSRLLYPSDLAKEYVTLCTVRDLVRDEWLIIDSAYADEVSGARSLQRSDGQVQIPALKESYVALFDRQVNGDGQLGRLFKEAYVVQEDRTKVARSTQFLEGVTQLVNDIAEGDEVSAARTACEVNANKMNTFESAISESSRVYLALEDYGKLAEQLVKTKAPSIANEVFPPSWQSMRHKTASEHCIYPLLSKVHPVTARFLCYDMLLQMEKRMEELEMAVGGYNLQEYLEDDYDLKEERTQSAAAALRKKLEKKIPILGDITGDANQIRKIRIKLQGSADSQSEIITAYLTDGLELEILEILHERVEQLAENYRIFFQSIGNMIVENNDRIAQLEKLEMPLGQIGVYCSKDAFQIMAAEYRDMADGDLPEETKTAIFERLFKVLSDDFEHAHKVETERQKAARAAKKNAELTETFRSAVVDTLRTAVTKNGSSVVDMNIRQALEKEYELEVPNMSFDEYLQDKISGAMVMAAPMLATSSNALAENTETVYMALNPECAASQMGAPNAAATQMLYVPQATAATDGLRATVLIDEAFSPYEITCFKARYKFSIEDLVKYAPQSDNAKAYRNRIANLGKRPPNVGDPDAYKTVVNPHLDRYWHEEAYLLPIYASEQRKCRMDTYKAFIYAMGLDLFTCMTDESVLDERGNPRKSWYFEGQNTPVKIRGGRVSGSYIDLYKSLPYNGRIKNEILQSALIAMKAEKRYYAAQELFEKVLELSFIEDLVQPSVAGADMQEQNILDILLSMRDAMKPDEWAQLFDGLREALWEFCAFLFDRNERMVNDAVCVIMSKMYANSKLGQKKAEDMNYGERELKSHVDAIADKVYRCN